MRRDQPTTPFDVDADETTQQFWGASKSWVSHEQPTVRRRAERTSSTPRAEASPARDDTTGSLRVIREGFAAFRPKTSKTATGETSRQRRHGEPRRPAPTATPPREVHVDARREATLGELAAGRLHVEGWLEDDFSDRDRYASGRHEAMPPAGRAHADHRAEHVVDHADVDPEYDVPLTPVQPLAERLGLGAVDPLLLRAGALVLALILLVPVVLSLRPEQDDSLPGDVVDAPQQVDVGAAPPSDVAAGATEGVSEQATASTASVATAPASEPMAATSPAEPSTSTVEPTAAVAPATIAEDPTTSVASGEADAAAAVEATAERVVPACPQTYTAATGDSWYRIADAAGVAPSTLLAENNAIAETVILPGDDICLPEGAAMPSPPTTEVPTTTDAPAASEPAPTTTAAPATTAPTTTVAPVPNLSRSEVEDLIRATWPADEVETALEIARRESNFIATADNGWCCVGVFQIYWTTHRAWLDDFGITERSDLFDARKNIAAAYHMWQRSGWGPWGG